MAQTLPSDFFPRALEILLPLAATAEDREALLIQAFYLHDPLLHRIDRGGAPKAFAVRLVKALLDYGFLDEGEHALARLLATARRECGADKHAEIDALVASLQQSNAPAPRPPAPLAPPAAPAPLQTLATPREDRQPTVFISYAHADADFANRLIADLRAAGHACWIDTTAIKGGDEWIMTIAGGINNSYAFVVVVTRGALESRWVQDEILWARQKRKPIVPLILEDVFHETRFFPLASYQGVLLLDGDYEAAIQKLLGALPSPALPDSPPPAAVAASPRAATREAELAYLERLRLEELLNTEKYTPMGGTSRQQQPRAEMRAVFELMRWGRDKLPQEPRRFENAVEEIRRLHQASRRAVLLGEPGGGKTTTLWKLAADLVETAREDRNAAIPLLIRLGKWTDAEQPLLDFIAAQLGDLGDSLDALLREKRTALLLDGLNELPAGQRDAKYPQVKQLIEAHPGLLAVVSCRELDYTVDFGFDRIQIMPLDPLRIREFARRYLDEEQGDELFWKLAGQAARNTHELFIRAFAEKLDEPERVFWLEPRLPEGVDWWWYWEDWLKLREAPSSLMVLSRNPYMLLMLTSVYAEAGELPENRGELFRLFVETLLKREGIPEPEQTPLAEGLAKVAYEMQVRRAGDREGDALTVLPKEAVSAILDERRLYLAGSASILSAGDQVRFTHQLLQEYFAARFMDIEIRAGRLQAATIWPSARWWERTNWEEAAVLLAGLYSDDCSRIVEWIAEANPEVAATCVVRSGAALAEAMAERLRAKWIPRLTDLKRDSDPKARAAVGRALGLTGWDNRKGVGIVHDARGVALPDIDWVEIPGGEFQYGHKDENDNPPQKLTLPTFHISRYPVTYAQFQTFLDDPEGFANPRWFEGLSADEDDRRMDEQEFKFTNHPRENVNWYRAMAFCRWLSWRLGGGYDLKKLAGWAARPPTEFEWEKAARGTDGRLYPYAGKFDAAKGNTNETGISQTSAVGIFPNGASPYGVMDLSGNVWEWCLSNDDKPALEARKENLRTDKNRFLRGGSWFYYRVLARAVARLIFPPASRYISVGCRVVCVVRPPSL